MLKGIYVATVMLLASFLQTVTGFGYAIITAPLLALVLAPKAAVMLVMVTGLVMRLFMLRAVHTIGDFRSIAPLTFASICGALPGAYLMTKMDGDRLKLFIALILLLAAWTLRPRANSPQSKKWPKSIEPIVGALSGFLATTTSVNGPPVVLYYLHAQTTLDKEVFRANLTRYFFLINIVSLLLSALAGTLQLAELAGLTFLSLPPLYVGFRLGERMFKRIDATLIRTASLWLIVCSSIAMIAGVFSKMF